MAAARAGGPNDDLRRALAQLRERERRIDLEAWDTPNVVIQRGHNEGGQG
jgi:hypothetical protein